MRNRDPHRENVENILAICLLIMTMQRTRESPSASQAMKKSAWHGYPTFLLGWHCRLLTAACLRDDETFNFGNESRFLPWHEE